MHPDLTVLTEVRIDVPTRLLAVLEADPDADLSTIPCEARGGEPTRKVRLDIVVVGHRRPGMTAWVFECKRGNGKSDNHLVRKTGSRLTVFGAACPASSPRRKAHMSTTSGWR